MFSKYEVYSTTESIYCYNETNVLRNKLGIKSQKQLKKIEEEITAFKQYEIYNNPIKGRFTKTHLFNIHSFLFGDIYSFAGKIRREQIGKADTWFYPPNLIDRELNKIFNFLKKNYCLRSLDNEILFDKLAYVMAELNIIHPFREGNGRAIREFIRLLALHNCYDLNWGNADKKEILDASILSVDDYTVLIKIIKKCIE